LQSLNAQREGRFRFSVAASRHIGIADLKGFRYRLFNAFAESLLLWSPPWIPEEFRGGAARPLRAKSHLNTAAMKYNALVTKTLTGLGKNPFKGDARLCQEIAG
jgi:hypothetical protein